MVKRIEEYMNLNYSIEVVPDRTTDGLLCYRAYHPELPGCMSHGETPEEAIANLTEARKIYIKVLLEKNQSIPLPKSSSMVLWAVIDVGSYEIEEEKTSLPGEINPIFSLELNKEEISIS